MDDIPEPDRLIQLVEQMHPEAEALQRLTDSMIVGGRLTDAADELIGHFVARARESGATWADIGACLGVTKQAAQKRFVTRDPERSPREGLYRTRFTESVRQAVTAAQDHARRAGSTSIGTEHLVLGLIDDPHSRAARAIVGLGVPLDELRAATVGDTGDVEPTERRHIRFSADSKKVLELALREAIRSKDRHIETEHVLLGILRDEGSAGARLLVPRGITRRAVAAWIETD
jgi:hypothetical protein